MNRPAGGDHRVNVLVAGHLDVEKIGAGFFDGLFESLSELPRFVDGASLESISACELFGIGETIELYGTEAIVVEQRLPLPHHAEIAVVHDDDLDGQGVRGDCGKLGDR